MWIIEEILKRKTKGRIKVSYKQGNYILKIIIMISSILN